MATFTCQWINRHDQLGFTNMDVVITDDDGVIPTVRFSKNWSASNPEDIDSTFLAAEAAILVDQVVEEWNALNEV